MSKEDVELYGVDIESIVSATNAVLLAQANKEQERNLLGANLPPREELETYPGAVVGFRMMMVCSSGLMHSITMGSFRWTAGTNRAQCSSEHISVPKRGCHCGLWAYKSLGALTEHAYDTQSLSGVVTCVVAAWGKIVEHELGFRAEKARPLAILDTGAQRQDIASKKNGLPIVRWSTVPTIIEEHGLDSLTVERPAEEELWPRAAARWIPFVWTPSVAGNSEFV